MAKQYIIERTRAIENATLLWSLTEIPERPSENTGDFGGADYVLPLERETQLADDFAFISARKDDPHMVMGVCVQEMADDAGLIVRIASNTGSLDENVAELRKVAAIMLTAAKRDISKEVATQRLFTQIVSMTRTRILTRLRSRHAPKTQKTRGRLPLPLLLREAVDAAAGSSRHDQTVRVQSQSQNIHVTFKKLEKANAFRGTQTFIPLLQNIVLQSSEIDTNGLIAVLKTNRKANPTTTAYLERAIRKLARYYAVARNLANASWNSTYRCISKVLIEPVDLAKFTLPMNPPTLISNLNQVMTRILNDNETTILHDNEERLLGIENRFQSRSSTERRVHAEIQIFLFYQLHPELKAPRVIASNKSACYLCNLFLKVQGQFRAPRSHGRIYEKWTFPVWRKKHEYVVRKLTPFVQSFNAALEARIRQELLPQGPSKRGYPAESVAVSNATWNSQSTIREPGPVHVASTHASSIATILEDGEYDVSTVAEQSAIEPATADVQVGEETIIETPIDIQKEQATELSAESATGSVIPTTIDACVQDEPSVKSQEVDETLGTDIAESHEPRYPGMSLAIPDDGSSATMEMCSFHLDFSMLDEPDSTPTGVLEPGTQFEVMVQPTESRADSVLGVVDAIVVDTDSMPPGATKVLPVGSAALQRTIVLREGKEEISVTFGLANIQKT